MSKQIRALAVIAAVAVMAACSGEPYATKIEKRWAGGTIRRIDLREVNGSVTIDPSSAGDVQLVADVQSRGIAPTKADNQGFFRTELDGDTLTVGRKNHTSIHFGLFSRTQLTVNYRLLVPPTIDVEVRTINGAIALHGVDGELNVSSVNGGIDIATAGRHELVATTVNGAVRARFLSGFQGATLKTVNGEVSAFLPESASFGCDLSQVNGDFEASFPLSIHSTPGSRRVSGTVNGGEHELRITTVNGDIELKNTPQVPVPGAPPEVPATMPSPPAPPPPPASAKI
jgi:hypothetical protein